MFVIVMGVTGCGKSTIGKLLAISLGLPFYDADAFHPAENRAKMAANIALSDADRWPWLERLALLAADWNAEGGAVLACSALKQAYRDLLVSRVRDSRIVYLELARAAAEVRLEGRRGKHEFVGDFDRLLAGQYRDLEPPGGNALKFSSELTPAQIVAQAVGLLGQC